MASSAEPARNPVSGALLSSADVARVVDRMAHQLIEKAGDGLPDLVLVGIPTRGAPLARRLAARIEAFSGTKVDVGTTDITLYRDDLRLRGVRALEPTVLPDGGIDDRLVVLVDDVLFSGRSVRAALDALRDLGRPRSTSTASCTLRGRPRSRSASSAARTERPEKRTSSTRTTSRPSMPPSGSTLGSSARTPRSRRSSR